MPTTNQKETGRKSLPVKWRDKAWPARITIRSSNRQLEVRGFCSGALTGFAPRAVRKLQPPAWGMAGRSSLSISRHSMTDLYEPFVSHPKHLSSRPLNRL